MQQAEIVTPPAAATTLRTALLVREMMQIAVFVEATAKPCAAQVRHRVHGRSLFSKLFY